MVHTRRRNTPPPPVRSRWTMVLFVGLLVLLAACSGPERMGDETPTATAGVVATHTPAAASATPTVSALTPTTALTPTVSPPTATLTPTSVPSAPSATPVPTESPTPAPTATATPTSIPTPASQAIDLPDVDTHYHLWIDELRIADGYVAARETITIREFRGDVPDVLYLQIVPAVYGFFVLDSLAIDGVETGPARLNDGMTLALDLPDGVQAPVAIDIAFRLFVGQEVTGWAGTTLDRGILRLGYWFPIISNDHGYSETLDPAYSATAAFDVTLVLDADVLFAHTGEVVGSETLDDGRVRYALTASNVRDFALVLSTAFTVDETVTGSGVRIELFTVGVPLATRQQVLAWAADAIEQLSALIGPYPYDTFRIADVGPSMPGGVEFPQLIYINPAYSPLDRLIYHEVAHQWLYGIIGTRVLEDGWVDEGGAEFFERGLPTGFTEVPAVPAGGYRYWLDSTYLELPPSPRIDWYYSIYEQGARFYYAVMDAMGADAFWESMCALYDAHLFGIVTAWDVLLNWQQHSAVDLRPLYHEYFRYDWIDQLPQPT